MQVDIVNTIEFQKLVEKVRARVENEDLEINEDDLKDEVLFALLEYYNDRHFSPENGEIYESIYEGVIIQLAISSIFKRGAEGEKSHSEGGVNRGYDNASNYPLSLTRKIIPLAKGVGSNAQIK
jgi:hypothetical protein